MIKPLREMKPREMPREKLEKYGAAHLSSEELLMILLGSGVQGYDVRAVARELIDIVDKKGVKLQMDDLVGVKGVGKVKAMNLLAAFELVRRYVREGDYKISQPTEVYDLIQHYGRKSQEYFLCVTLNGANEVMSVRVVTIGLLNRTQVHPREVFADAIAERAASIVVAHNHPSGNLQPSREDLSVTRRLCEAGDLLGIRVLDHLIINAKDYYSLADHDEM